MLRTWVPHLLAGCIVLGGCTDEISVGDTRDSDEVREDERLEDFSQKLRGSWLSVNPPSVPRIRLTFTPGRKPRSGSFVLTCADDSVGCDSPGVLGDAGLPVKFQPMAGYELFSQSREGLTLCVLSSGDQSISVNLSVDASGDQLTLGISPPSVSGVFTRE